MTDPPPDAGASYLGTYGFGPWTVWLMNRASELVAETLAELMKSRRPPLCPACCLPMVRRPDAWKCYRHRGHVDGEELPPTVVLDVFKPLRAPQIDVLRRTGDMLDTVYEDGEWKVRKL